MTDRPTKAHEYVFLLSKSATYAYDADAIREPQARLWDPAKNGDGPNFAGNLDPRNDPITQQGHRGTPSAPNPAGANKRSVWTVATQPYAGAHFATFPPKLIEPCILAGAPERACGECGAPWVRVVERTSIRAQLGASLSGGKNETLQQTADGRTRQNDGNLSFSNSHDAPQTTKVTTLGFEPSCPHGDGSASGVVLDPFAGAGTTGMVALQHGRDFVGIELNPAYAQMARDRIGAWVRCGFRAPKGEAAAPEGQNALF